MAVQVVKTMLAAPKKPCASDLTAREARRCCRVRHFGSARRRLRAGGVLE